MIAEKYSNRIFEPACLTEDYENGFRIKRLGLPQKFIPIHFRHARPLATREQFPIDFKKAVNQRTRWVTGITLQSWEYHRARETLRHLYWFWRDRKGLAGNLITPLANILFLFGLSTWTWARATHHEWLLAREMSRFYPIYVSGLSIQVLQTVVRAGCSARIYGWRFACGVPLRVVLANAMNCAATSRAIYTYTSAKIRHRPLDWVKTEHAYPNQAALMTEHRRLREVLVQSGPDRPGATRNSPRVETRGPASGRAFVVARDDQRAGSLRGARSAEQSAFGKAEPRSRFATGDAFASGSDCQAFAVAAVPHRGRRAVHRGIGIAGGADASGHSAFQLA